MERNYKSYDEEYEKNIVKLIENGKAISDIVREYGISRSLVYSWKKKYGTITAPDETITFNDDIENLKKELKVVREENEILKKAVAIFTKR